jgi:hypothetical protein
MKELQLPPPACAVLCKNAMNEICIEECTPKRDMSSFEQNDLTLPEMPQYPDTTKLTWEEAYLKRP